MLSYCCPTHSLLRGPKPHYCLRSGGTWRFRGQEKQPSCEPWAVVSEDREQALARGAGSLGVGLEEVLLLRWLADGLLAFPCCPVFLAGGPCCPQAVPTLRPLERRDSFLSCVSLGATGQPPGRSGAGDGGSSATLTGAVALQRVPLGGSLMPVCDVKRRLGQPRICSPAGRPRGRPDL